MKQKPKLLDTGLPKVYYLDIDFGKNQRVRMILPNRTLAQEQAQQIRNTVIYMGNWITNIQIQERDAQGTEFI
jgi:hypothetical protein